MEKPIAAKWTYRNQSFSIRPSDPRNMNLFRRFCLILSCNLVLLLVLISQAYAAPGEFDTTFGIPGKITTPLGSTSIDIIRSLAVQPDGKIVAVGIRNVNHTVNHTVIARYHPDGSLDQSFANNGILILQLSATSGDQAISVEVQSDGKILVAGDAYQGTATATDFYVLRFNENGTFDSSFGSNGKVFTDFNGLNDIADAMVIQPDGRIILAGQTATPNSRFNFALVRYNADGSLDPRFGNGGKVDLGTPTFESLIRDVQLQSDGKIVAVGRRFSGTDSDFVVLRYDSDGAFDTSFDQDGMVVTSFGAMDFANSVEIQPDGKIFAVGTASVGSPSRDVFTAARFNIDGSFDTTFDGDGKLTTAIGDWGDVAYDTVILPDGKMLVAGTSQDQFSLVRYNVDGSLDSGFDGDGKVTTALGTIEDKGFSLALAHEGKIIVGGSSFDGTSERDLALVRYNSNGQVDGSFGLVGRVQTSVANLEDTAFDVAVQPDGKIVSAGTTGAAAGFENLAVVRYFPSGELDTSFGIGGKVTVQLGSSAIDSDFARLELLPGGKIIVGGYGKVNDQFRIVVARLNPNGSLDSSFGTGGRVILSNGSIAEGYLLEDVAVQQDGKAVLGCLGSVNGAFDFILIRLNSNGLVDSTFDSDGKAIVSVSAGHDRLHAISIQNDNKILAAGSVEQGPESRIGVARFNSDGSVDSSFGVNGVSMPNPGNTSIEGRAMSLQLNGEIIVAGGSVDSFGAVRLHNDGSLDTDFGNNGLARVSIPTAHSAVVRDISIQENGKIVLVGLSVDLMSEFDFTIVRLTRNGARDLAFDGDGLLIPDLGNWGEGAYGVALQSDRKIIVAGGINEYARRTFAVLRLPSDPAGTSAFDYDGDGRTDMSVFRPNEGNWYLLQSSAGFRMQSWGLNGDKLVPADYDGDGKTDMAVLRPGENNWYILNSSNSTVTVAELGASGDLTVPADYTGDGKAELAVYRPSQGRWYLKELNGQEYVQDWGLPTDKPAPADFDGDGRLDLAIFRPSEGRWYIIRSSDAAIATFNWGLDGDIPIPGDYSGDGRSDFCVFRPSDQTWYRIHSDNFHVHNITWGVPGDLPTPGDYDGDGKQDLAVFRPSNGNWYLFGSTSGPNPIGQPWGLSGDIPTPNSFVY